MKTFAFLDERDFYELMQEYRFSPIGDNDRTVKAFEAVKSFIRSNAQFHQEQKESNITKQINPLSCDWYVCRSCNHPKFKGAMCYKNGTSPNNCPLKRKIIYSINKDLSD